MEKNAPAGWVAAAACFFALAACDAVGPDFRSPEVMQPSRFAFTPSYALRPAAEHEWWQGLHDPVLDGLVVRGLEQNLDLQAAQARIREARALLGTVGRNAQLSGNASVRAIYTRGETGGWFDNRAADFEPSFLADLFGGVRREQEAAIARTISTEFDQSTVRLGLMLEIISSYTDLRQSEAELRARRQEVSAKSRIVDTVQERLELGEALLVDLRRAQAELASSRAVLPSLMADRDTQALRISTLLAEPPERVLKEIQTGRAVQPLPDGFVDPGVPAALLRNRPDIRSAEAQYAAAIAEIGVSEAQLYPTLRVNGTIRIASDNTLGIGPNLSFPVLGREALKSQTEAARARAEQAEIAWRQAVLAASEEVQAALVQLHHADRQVRLLQDAVSANEAAVRLAREAFELGALTLSDILEAELNLAAANIQLTIAKDTYAVAWAQLNVAIGMGWYPTKTPMETKPEQL